jgi:hypothetical protein
MQANLVSPSVQRKFKAVENLLTSKKLPVTHHLHDCNRLFYADSLIDVLDVNRSEVIRVHDAMDNHIKRI